MSSCVLNPLLSKANNGASPYPYPSFASPSYYSRRSGRLLGSRSPVVVRCKEESREPQARGSVDRRDLLFGLGSLYSATLALNRDVLAAPITTPDISTCRNSNIDLGNRGSGDPLRGTICCPPTEGGMTAVDYQIPKFTTLRLRSPAHALSSNQIRDYESAIAKSRNMDQSDPRSYVQQAKIHCAYCNSGYDQAGFEDLVLQVHSCWLFLPFHRWYLYFYERILGKLCNNENFGLPFWNWDNPPGMTMPRIFINPNSSLYDKERDFAHLPPVIINLDNPDSTNFTPQDQIDVNLWFTYLNMVGQGKSASCYHGGRYVGGDEPNPGQGTSERLHNAAHRWVGNPANNYGEDMGNFYSSGYDPLFFCHHSNVDRLWSVWQELGGTDFTDPDWLNASFRFYDENGKLVRVYVKDCLDNEKLGYKFQKMELPWLKRRARKLTTTTKPKRTPALEATLPTVLGAPIKTTVKVPKRTKPDDESVLVVEIEHDKTKYLLFDIYVNAEDTDTPRIAPADKAGNFVNIPRTPRPGDTLSLAKFEISELLEDIGAVGDDEVQITIVPRQGKNVATIKSVSIRTTCDN